MKKNSTWMLLGLGMIFAIVQIGHAIDEGAGESAGYDADPDNLRPWQDLPIMKDHGKHQKRDSEKTDQEHAKMITELSEVILGHGDQFTKCHGGSAIDLRHHGTKIEATCVSKKDSQKVVLFDQNNLPWSFMVQKTLHDEPCLVYRWLMPMDLVKGTHIPLEPGDFGDALVTSATVDEALELAQKSAGAMGQAKIQNAELFRRTDTIRRGLQAFIDQLPK